MSIFGVWHALTQTYRGTDVHLAAITGSVSGLGFNPIPTFDWNQFTVFVGAFLSILLVGSCELRLYLCQTR